jgi:hypothetical protein
LESGASLSEAIPEDLFRETVVEGLTAAENTVKAKITGAALAARLSTADIAPHLQQTEIGEKRKEFVARLAPLALKEWGIDPQLSPTTAIALVLAPWAYGALSAYKTLANLALERAKRDAEREKANAPRV